MIDFEADGSGEAGETRESFVPENIDFELRAGALSGYQRHIPNSVTKDPKRRCAEIVFRTLTNIAYIPLVTKDFENALSEVGQDHFKGASVRDKVFLLGIEILKSEPFKSESLRSALPQRKALLTKLFRPEQAASHTSHESANEDDRTLLNLFERFELRTSVKSLKNDCVTLKKMGKVNSVLDVAIEDEDGREPWMIPNFVRSTEAEDIKQQRIKVLHGIRRILMTTEISEFEVQVDVSEFGTPRISFLKLSNAVHELDASVYPAEVGTVLLHLQNRLEIADKRTLLRRLMSEFYTYIGGNEIEILTSDECDELMPEYELLDDYLFQTPVEDPSGSS